MTVRSKLLSAYLASAVLAVGVGLFMLNTNRQISQSLSEYEQHFQQIIQAATEAASYAKRAESHLLLFLALHDEKDRGKFYERCQSLEENLRVLDLQVRHPKARAILEALKPQAAKVQPLGVDVLTAYDESARPGVLFDHAKHRDGIIEFQKATSRVREMGVELAVLEAKLESDSRSRAVSRAGEAQRTAFAVLLGGTALTCLLGLVFARRISQPIVELTAAAAEIGRGNLDTVITVKSRDEVGSLAASFNQMVADLKQSQSEFVAARDYADNIVRSMHDALIVVAPGSGTIQRVNEGTCELLGYSAEELVGKPIRTVLVPRDEETPFRSRDVEETRRLTAKDGSCVLVSCSSSSMYDQQGQLLATVYVARDLRDLLAAKAALEHANDELERRVEGRTAELAKSNEALVLAKDAAERANGAKSEFLSRMSHELRTPLNAILGFGQLLEMEELKDEQQESVSQILSGGHHLLDLINEVLDISRIESGQMELSLEPVALLELMAEVVTLMRPMARERQVRLLNFTPDIAGQHVMADRQRLKQVFMNLLSNAIKYNRQDGEVRVNGSVSAAEAGAAPQVCIEVTDSGIGMNPDQLRRLFTPYERLGAERTKVEGTGLGLALSKRLVEMISGTLSVRSEAGVGSTFTVCLASAEGPSDGLQQPVEVVTARVDASQKTVLHVEDNLSNLRLVELLLKSRPDLKLISTLQGSVGLDMAREHLPDVILLDVHLPDLGGAEVLQRLRGDKRTSGIPVIMISADATASQIERLTNGGAAAYLTKPLHVADFLKIVDETLAAVPPQRA